VCTAAMLDHAIGPNVIGTLNRDMLAFMEKRGYSSLDDFRGLRRDRVVTHSQIRRPDDKAYHGGHDREGYAVSPSDKTTDGH
jgi:dihydropyrimidine dehydrogenase (NAD+) subunit PreA